MGALARSRILPQSVILTGAGKAFCAGDGSRRTKIAPRPDPLTQTVKDSATMARLFRTPLRFFQAHHCCRERSGDRRRNGPATSATSRWPFLKPNSAIRKSASASLPPSFLSIPRLRRSETKLRAIFSSPAACSTPPKRIAMGCERGCSGQIADGAREFRWPHYQRKQPLVVTRHKKDHEHFIATQTR